VNGGLLVIARNVTNELYGLEEGPRLNLSVGGIIAQ
jgi:hypothetical protein